MRKPKLLRWILFTVGGLLVGLVLFVSVLALARIPIDLSRFKETASDFLSKALNRPVAIDGKMVVTTSVAPVFSVEGLRISNPNGFPDEDFLTLKSARIQVKLLPLLKAKVHIPEISVQGFSANLRENQQGLVNWVIGDASSDETSPPPKSTEAKPSLATSVPWCPATHW